MFMFVCCFLFTDIIYHFRLACELHNAMHINHGKYLSEIAVKLVLLNYWKGNQRKNTQSCISIECFS